MFGSKILLLLISMVIPISIISMNAVRGYDRFPVEEGNINNSTAAIDLSMEYLGYDHEDLIARKYVGRIVTESRHISDTLLIREGSSASTWLIEIDSLLLNWQKDSLCSDTMYSKYVNVNVLIDSLTGHLLKIEFKDIRYPAYKYTDLDLFLSYGIARGEIIGYPGSLPKLTFLDCLKRYRYYEPKIAKRIIAVYYEISYEGKHIPVWVITLMGKPPFKSSMGFVYTNSRTMFNANNGHLIHGASYGDTLLTRQSMEGTLKD